MKTVLLKFAVHAGDICRLGPKFEFRGEDYFNLFPVNGNPPHGCLRRSEFSPCTDSENDMLNNMLYALAKVKPVHDYDYGDPGCAIPLDPNQSALFFPRMTDTVFVKTADGIIHKWKRQCL